MKSLRRDLFERRLWPLVIVLIAVIVAVPFLLHGHRASAGAAAPPPPSSSSTTTPAATTTHRAKSTHHASVPTSTTRDPFAAADVAAVAGSSASSTSTTSTTTNSPSTGSSSDAGASGSGSADSSSGSSSSDDAGASSSTSSSDGASSSSSSSTTSTTSTTTSTTPPATGTATETRWTLYSTDLRIGAAGHLVTHENLPLLTPLPDDASPVVMFMGVADHAREAVFALGAGVEVATDGKTRSTGVFCDPSDEDCAMIAVPAGKSVRLAYVSSTGAQEILVLSLSRITSQVTDSATVAAAFRKRHSAVGLCDLELGDPIGFYDPVHGTMEPMSTSACRRNKSVVVFPGTLGAGSSERG